MQTFVKSELNLNFDLNIPKLNENLVSEFESDFKKKHRDDYDLSTTTKNEEESKRELKYLEFINRKLKNEFKYEDDEDEGGNVIVRKDNTTDTSAVFLSKLTDTQIANSDNDEQLILVNKKPSANKEFLDKLTEIYKREIRDLREDLEILRENFELIKMENKSRENMMLGLNEAVLNEKLKKRKFYKKLIENLFSTLNKQQEEGEEEATHDDVEDQEFYKNLKNNLIRLRETYDRTVDETRKSIDSLKINFLADKQKHFNEAIDRVSKEKDRQIEELKQIQTKQSNEIAELKQKLVNEGEKDEALQRSLMKQQKLLERVQVLEQQFSKTHVNNNKSTISSSTIVTQQPSPIVDNQPLAVSTITTMPQNPPNNNNNNKYQLVSNILQLNS